MSDQKKDQKASKLAPEKSRQKSHKAPMSKRKHSKEANLQADAMEEFTQKAVPESLIANRQTTSEQEGSSGPLVMSETAAAREPKSMEQKEGPVDLVAELGLNRLEVRDQLTGILSRIEDLCQRQVRRKCLIEDRWYEDLRQYHGRYDASMERELGRDGRSRVYVGLTRAKTNAWAARLSDMLFPTDDRNWGLRQNGEAPQPQSHPQAGMRPGGPIQPQKMAGPLPQSVTGLDPDRTVERMQKLMENQLKASRYGVRARDVIDDACKLGTGILKGPSMGRVASRPLEQNQDGQQDRLQPEFERIDPWSFFPDMSSALPEEWEFTFERHLYNRKALRKLASRPGFIRAEISDLLKTDPVEMMPDYVGRLREIGDQVGELGSVYGTAEDRRYVVWEYHGPLDSEETRQLAIALGEEELARMADDDPLEELQVILWYCQGRVLKLALHPLDSQESLYSVFNFERDETSCFGNGVPHLMRDSQAALNAAWRMTLDNAGLAVAPQVVINKDQIAPADGDWTITPNKVWFRKDDDGTPISSAFEIYHVDSRQDYLNNVMQMALQFIDQETSLPQVAQGEAGSLPVNTATGMSLLMESANVIFRRAVRNWDDDMTMPLMRKLYHWNIQFHDDQTVKGNFEVEARGSSVLLVRHMQGTNLMRFIGQFGTHPMFGEMIKPYDSLRRIAQTHMLPAEDILYSEEELIKRAEIKAKQAAEMAAKQPDPVQLDLQRKQAELQIKQRETAMKEQELQLKSQEQQHKAHMDHAKFTLDWEAEQAKWSEKQLFAKGFGENPLNRVAQTSPRPVQPAVPQYATMMAAPGAQQPAMPVTKMPAAPVMPQGVQVGPGGMVPSPAPSPSIAPPAPNGLLPQGPINP